MDEDKTTIQVFKSDAEAIKQAMPHLKSDAYRIAEILKGYHIVSIDTLPRPADGVAVPVVTVSVSAGK